MHKAKTGKNLLAVFASIALVFSGLVGISTPAQAASLNGCVSSNWSPNSCGGNGSTGIVTPISNITGTVGSAIATTSTPTTTACTPTSWALYRATDTSYATPLTRVVGIVFSTANGTFSGTPTSPLNPAVSYVVVATCTNASAAGFNRFSLDINVTGSSSSPLLTPDSVFISGTVGTAITSNANFTETNFNPASGSVRYSVTTGTLPAGLTISVRGIVSGTPSAVSNSTITVTAVNDGTDSATAGFTFDITAATPPPSGGSSEPDRKVTICHRTHAVTNPYVRITVDYNSVNKKSGHQGHDEIFAGQHVFAGAAAYPRAKDKLWGDIIPPDPSGLNRWKPLNWFEGGKAIYESPTSVCPAYDPVKYYNQLRESGVPEKKIKAEIAELETEQSEAQPTKKTDTASLKYTGTDPKALEEENDKVTICHRTNSVTNPYRRITVAASSIYKTKGHYSHDEIYDGEHVFNSKVTYPNNQKDWGDIIPEDPSGKNRWKPLNMTTLGKQIYEGIVAGCAELTNEEFYNKLREDGLPKKEVKKDLEEQGNVDDDPKDVDDSHYTGNDPQVEKTEPKPPVQPEGKKPIAQSLSGIVWLDLNRDGLKDPDEPLMPKIVLSVVQVTSVTPANVRGSVRAAGLKATAVKPAAVVTVNTDANGYYEFPSLGAGDWKVVTGIPDDLSVTYDSQSIGDGEIIATVPVGSFAFTWVGLVGDNPTVDKKYIDEILKANPTALPKSELPTWYLAEVKAAKVAAAKKAAAAKAASINGRTELAFTGDNPWLEWLFSGLLMIAGLALSAFGLRKAKKSKA